MEILLTVIAIITFIIAAFVGLFYDRVLKSGLFKFEKRKELVVSTPVSPITLYNAIVQQVTDGQEVYFDLKTGRTGLDLTGYTLEMVLDGANGRVAQLFFKDCNFRDVYSIAQPIPTSFPMQFNPVRDPRQVNGFSDFTCIASVGIKVFDSAEGIKIVSAKLILK